MATANVVQKPPQMTAHTVMNDEEKEIALEIYGEQ